MNVGRAVSGRERRAVVARAKAARDAAHALLTGEQEALARIGEAAAKLRRCLADGRLDATLIGDLRATSAGHGLRTQPYHAAGLYTVGQLMKMRDRLESLRGVGPATAAQTRAAITALAQVVAAQVDPRPDAARRTPLDTALLLELARLQHHRQELGPVLPAARDVRTALNGHLAGARRAATRRLGIGRSAANRADDDAALAAVTDAMGSAGLRPAVESVLSAHGRMSALTVTEQVWDDYHRHQDQYLALLAEAERGAAKPSDDVPPGLMRCLLGIVLIGAPLAPLFQQSDLLDGSPEHIAMRIVSLLVGGYLLAWGRWAWKESRWAPVPVPGAGSAPRAADLRKAPGFGRILFGVVWLFLTIVPPDNGVFGGHTAQDVVKIVWIVVSAVALVWGMLARTTSRGRKRAAAPPVPVAQAPAPARLAPAPVPHPPTPQAPAPPAAAPLPRLGLAEPAPQTPPAPVAARATARTPVPPAAHPARWVPGGEPVQVGFLTINGGLVYVGQGLFADGMAEPSLIDPALPVDYRRPDWSGTSPYHVPSYAQLTPGARAAYLTWLGDGRCYPDAPTAFAFLFLYGLERRVLLDLATAADPAADLAHITDQVLNLLAEYGGDRPFATHAARFLLLLRALQTRDTAQLPHRAIAVSAERGSAPLSLRLALAAYAATGTPVPADWALTWARHQPAVYLGSSGTRYVHRFDELFRIRYTQQFAAGMRVNPKLEHVSLPYRPANPAAPRQQLTLAGWPDVFDSPIPVAHLAELARSAHADLQPYYRWLDANPHRPETLTAVSLLPRELVRDDHSAVAALRRWADKRLDGRQHALVNAGTLNGLWPEGGMDGISVLLRLLGQLGFGIEPDPRTSRAELTDVVVLFRAEDETAPATGGAYTAAATLLRLAVTVSAADGDISADEQELLIAHLRTGLHLTRAEQVRLEAHLQWLIASGTRLAGIKDRLARLTRDQSEKIGRFLVAVAAADGVISPPEVVTLRKIYDLIGLPPTLLADELDQLTGVATAQVAPDSPAPAGPVAVPPPAANPAVSPARPVTAGPAADRRHRAVPGLDAEVLAAKLHETASVAALLTSIFAEHDAQPAVAARPVAPAPAAVPDVAVPLAGLDAAHAALLTELLTRPSWPRAEFDRLAARHGLMPAGAIEVLNEAAYEAVDDAILDGDDELVINEYVLKEAGR
ncbi:hypothetical protein GCM10009662_38730 [Catellatospora coxensis]